MGQNVPIDNFGTSEGLSRWLVAKAPLLLPWQLLGSRGSGSRGRLQLDIGLGRSRLRLSSLRHIVDELAAHAVGAVPVGAVLFAQFGLVQDRNIGLDHHVIFGVGERALKLDKVKVTVEKLHI
jgi:hypothetical protein